MLQLSARKLRHNSLRPAPARGGGDKVAPRRSFRGLDSPGGLAVCTRITHADCRSIHCCACHNTRAMSCGPAGLFVTRLISLKDFRPLLSSNSSVGRGFAANSVDDGTWRSYQRKEVEPTGGPPAPDPTYRSLTVARHACSNLTGLHCRHAVARCCLFAFVDRRRPCFSGLPPRLCGQLPNSSKNVGCFSRCCAACTLI
jgi:hypothetical protein